jgi:hypothetical protein
LSQEIGVKHVPGEPGSHKQGDGNLVRIGGWCTSPVSQFENPGRGILEKSDGTGFSILEGRLEG